MLKAAGAKQVTLQTSFRSQPNIQRVINAAFAPVMTGDPDACRPTTCRCSRFGRMPRTTVRRRAACAEALWSEAHLQHVEIEKSLPDAVGAYIHWLINESGWKVAERIATTATSVDASRAAWASRPAEREHLVPVQARHICLLFRRFVSYDEDATRPYVQALEARGVPHLLVGGRTFHNRDEIETLRAALAAIEWPDDELSVFATLRGSLFAIGDEELLEYPPSVRRTSIRSRHPGAIWITGVASSSFAPQAASALHKSAITFPSHRRSLNCSKPRARTSALRSSTAASRCSPTSLTSPSWRAATKPTAASRSAAFSKSCAHRPRAARPTEAPILEEGSDGVRLMTVHKAKGLEFPVVILADMTAKLHRATASRYLDAAQGVCAVQLAGCSPRDLIDHEQDELRRDAAEGARLAYVAATRARDLLVIPAVGDAEREGWIQSLNSAIYPRMETRRQQTQPPGCIEFKSKDSVLSRPDGDPAHSGTVCPGLHHPADHSIVWWDPTVLNLGVELSLGIRKPDLIVKDVPSAIVDFGLGAYKTWRQQRDASANAASSPSIAAQPATAWAKSSEAEASARGPAVEVIELPRDDDRPGGIRFGALVHAALATVPLDADPDTIRRVVATQARTLGATPEEVSYASSAVANVLAHPILDRARSAQNGDVCRREVPVTLRTAEGALVEGFVNLAFSEGKRWTVVDFKTDEEFRRGGKYELQVGLYVTALQAATKQTVSGILMRI